MQPSCLLKAFTRWPDCLWMLRHGHAWRLHVDALQEGLPHALKRDASSREEQEGDLRGAC